MTVVKISRKTKTSSFDPRVWDLVALLRAEERKMKQAALGVTNQRVSEILMQIATFKSDCAVQLITHWDKIYTTNLMEAAASQKIPVYHFNPSEAVHLHVNDAEAAMLQMLWQNEKQIIKFYHSLLNDPSVLLKRRELLRQQLNNILCALVHIKILGFPMSERCTAKQLFL